MIHNNLLKDYLTTELDMTFDDKDIENVKVDGCKVVYYLRHDCGTVKKQQVELYHLLEFIYDISSFKLTF